MDNKDATIPKNTEVPATKPESKTISMPKEAYDMMMKRLEKLEDMQKNDDDVPVIGGIEEDREFTCRVKSFKGRPVSFVSDVVFLGKDPQGESIMECTVHTVSAEGKIIENRKADYLKLVRTQGDECKILKTKSKNVTKKGDIVNEKVFSDKKEVDIFTGRKVRLAVNFVQTSFVVDWKGEEVELKELN